MTLRRGIVVTTFITILAKGIAFVTTVCIGRFFGFSQETDVYYFVVSFAVISSAFFSGLDQFLLIPEATRIRIQRGDEAARRFLNLFVVLYMGLGMLFGLLFGIFPVQTYGLFTKIPEAALASNLVLLRLGSFLFLLQLVSSLCSSILASYGRFTASALNTVFSNLFAMLMVLLFHDSGGITLAIFGLVLGYCISFGTLLYLMRARLHWKLLGFGAWRDVSLKKVGYVQLNILPVLLRNYAVVYLISGLGAGTLTSLNLAQAIIAIPETFILTQALSVIAIRLNEYGAARNFESARQLILQVAVLFTLLLLPVSLTVFAAGKAIADILFLHRTDKAVNPSVLYYCLLFLSLSILSRLPDLVFGRIFSAFNIYKPASLAAFVAHSIITAVIVVGTMLYGLSGYFAALLISYYLIFPAIMFLVLRKHLPELLERKITLLIARCAATCAILIPVGYYTYHHTEGVPKLLLIAVVAVASFAAVFGLMRLLGQKEVSIITFKLLRP